MDSAKMAGLNNQDDDEFGALIMRKAFEGGHSDQARALNLMNVIRSLFISRSSLDELERVVESGRVDQLLNCLQRDDHKLDTAKFILDTMRANIKLNAASNNQLEQTTARAATNRKVVNFLLKLFQIVNDNLSPLADEDELEHLGQMIVFYLDLIKLNDIHERLTFYTRFRSCVGNLHLVLEQLIRRVLQLPASYNKQMERKRSARQNFLNGCLAFALATIPAFYNKLELQLELSELALGLALRWSSLSLANYYVKHILNTLQTLLLANPNNDNQPTRRAHLESRLASILALIIGHQDYIDLKHRLALRKLINKSPFPLASESLLQSLKHLDYIELLAQDNDAASRGSVNNISNTAEIDGHNEDEDDDDDDESN